MERSGSLVSASTLGTILLVISSFQTWKFRLVAEAQNVSVPAVFIFDDSYSDTGNNDYIATFSKTNFPPYGRDFINHMPTGRVSNGKLMPDYFAEGLGVKDLLPPYLDPKLQDSDLITGVSFAYAGSGLDNLTSKILELYSLNARKIGLINVPPLGCLPAERTLHILESKGGCVEVINRAASGFNEGLNAMIEQLKPVLPGLKMVSLDFYALILDFIQNPGKSGFDVTNRGCCGTGDIEVGFLCNKFTPFTCADADKYLFFDSMHLSQKAYQEIANIFLRREIIGLL